MTKDEYNVGARKKILILMLLLITYFSCMSAKAVPRPGPAFTQAINDIIYILTRVGGALGVLMMSIYGIQWIVASDPSERENAKKAIVYTLIGLVLLMTSRDIVYYLLT